MYIFSIILILSLGKLFDYYIYKNIVKYEILAKNISYLTIFLVIISLYFLINKNDSMHILYLVLAFLTYPIMYFLYFKEKYIDKGNKPKTTEEVI